MYSKYAAHVSSNGSQFVTAGFLVYATYIRSEKLAMIRQKIDNTMYSKYATHISSNLSHFLKAGFLVY